VRNSEGKRDQNYGKRRKRRRESRDTPGKLLKKGTGVADFTRRSPTSHQETYAGSQGRYERHNSLLRCKKSEYGSEGIRSRKHHYQRDDRGPVAVLAFSTANL